jgi:hypothetical protein
MHQSNEKKNMKGKTALTLRIKINAVQGSSLPCNKRKAVLQFFQN